MKAFFDKKGIYNLISDDYEIVLFSINEIIVQEIFKDKPLISNIKKEKNRYIENLKILIVGFNDLSEEFSKAMFLFLKSFDVKIDNKNLTTGSDLFTKIIDQKLTFLKDIISLSNNDVNKQNKLIYSYQKDKTLFDREIKKLIEK